MADRIEDLLRVWEPRVRDAFLLAIRNHLSTIDFRALVVLIRDGDIDGAVVAVGLDPVSLRPLQRALEDAFEAGGVDTAGSIKPVRGPLGARIGAVFDVRSPEADAYIRQHTADLVRQITDDQRALIRSALSPLQAGLDPMLTGETPQKLALDLVGRINRVSGGREGGVIGLTRQQAEWAARYRAELNGVPDASALERVLRDKRFDRTVARAIREGQPIPAETREAMVAAYRNKALRYRGEMIAQHEATSVLHQSQLEAWDQAIARGVVTEENVRKFWITAGDDRVRPTHAAIPGMNSGGVRLRAQFDTPIGPQLYPPIEPNCRCRVRVRRID